MKNFFRVGFVAILALALSGCVSLLVNGYSAEVTFRPASTDVKYQVGWWGFREEIEMRQSTTPGARGQGLSVEREVKVPAPGQVFVYMMVVATNDDPSDAHLRISDLALVTDDGQAYGPVLYSSAVNGEMKTNLYRYDPVVDSTVAKIVSKKQSFVELVYSVPKGVTPKGMNFEGQTKLFTNKKI